MTWKIIIFASALKSIASSLYILCRLLLIRWMLQKEVNKFNLILNRVREWMILESSHIDLLFLIIQHNNDDTKEYMMKQEIISNVTLFIAADIKTVTTLLFALTYLLTQNEWVRKRLTRKIQARFASESLITVQSVNKLQYLTTCIQETLWLFSLILEELSRVISSESEKICDRWISDEVCIISCFFLRLLWLLLFDWSCTDVCTSQ